MFKILKLQNYFTLKKFSPFNVRLFAKKAGKDHISPSKGESATKNLKQERVNKDEAVKMNSSDVSINKDQIASIDESSNQKDVMDPDEINFELTEEERNDDELIYEARLLKEKGEKEKKELIEKQKLSKQLKNAKYNIKFHGVKKEDKDFLEKLALEMLRNEAITPERTEEIKKEIRDPLNDAHGRHLTKIHGWDDVEKYIQSFSDQFFYDRTFECMDRLIQYEREKRDESNPNYIQVRSQHKLVTNDRMYYPIKNTADIRQNVNDPEWLKPQPRMILNYNYNIEENKQFYKNYAKLLAEDKVQTLEKQRLLKYMKLNPDSMQVKNRFLPKLPIGITLDKIPDYDVDISNYKPAINRKTRKSLRKINLDTDVSNYEAWRCFDRNYKIFSIEQPFVNVELSPKNLINAFGLPYNAICDECTGSYYFEDENLDVYLIIDWKQTQSFWGYNYNDEFYAEQAERVHPNVQERKWPSYEEFWEITEPKEFRIYYDLYSEFKKFKRWLKLKVNKFDPQKDKTMDQILDEKFGKLDDYSDYNLIRKNKLVPAIYHYNRDFFMEKDEKRIVEEEPFNFPKYISPKEGEYFDYEEFILEESRKGKKKSYLDYAETS